MPVQKVPNSWGELKNLEPAAYGTSDIPDTPVPFDPGIPERQFVPGDWGKWDTWQQMLLQLKDVPFPDMPADIGKSLVLRPMFDENSGYSVSWEIPANSETADRLTNPRNFSITGDGTASPVAFDGTANVVLNITNAQAAKWTNPRTITFNGLDAVGSVVLDGSANVSVALDVQNSDNADKWKTPRTITVSGDATGAVNLDGSGNVSLVLDVQHADNATTATNANHANTADSATTAGSANTANSATTAATANALANGAITVTLTGDVTGTAAISGGTVTIPTTATGGGGGTGPDGQTQFGNSTQYWGRATTVASGGNAELTISFSTPFTGANNYSIVFGFPENVGAPSGDVDFNYTMSLTSRLAGSITFNVSAKDSGGAISAVGWIFSYIAVGQTTP